MTSKHSHFPLIRSQETTVHRENVLCLVIHLNYSRSVMKIHTMIRRFQHRHKRITIKCLKIGLNRDQHFLLQHFRKDQHCLTQSTLNPVDRQNYSSAVRMCSDKVIDLLKVKVPNSSGTVAFLMIMRNIIDAFSPNDISPLQRIHKMWYTVFLFQIRRRFICKTNGLKLKNNFITQNAYSCVELNAHNLILIMLHLKNQNLENFFLCLFYTTVNRVKDFLEEFAHSLQPILQK